MQKTVMVIDDDRGILETIVAILDFEGYETISCQSPFEAFEELASCTPDLILLDIMMPLMDGLTFVAELEARGLRGSIPIVVITASGKAKRDADQINAAGYVEKPFTIPGLLDVVETAMSGV